MEKSQSVESTSSFTSSLSSSRSAKRLQDQIAAGQSRPLKPKGGSEGISMSRNHSSRSMTRIESKDGSQDKVAVSKPSYQRPKHERVCCKLCDNHPDGFRGEHELRRHVDREHKTMVKKWVCLDTTDGGQHPEPTIPLSRCKSCLQKKKYGAYYNAAAHLRRSHFNPKRKGRSKTSQKIDDGDKRGGKGGGDDPPMTELKKYWIQEVEERVDINTDSQQEAADESDEEISEDYTEGPMYSQQTFSSISTQAFDTSYLANNQPAIFDYSTNIISNDNNNETYDMSADMSLEFSDSKQQVLMDQAIFPLLDQNNNFPYSSSDLFPNDPVSFTNSIPSQSYQNFDGWN